MSLFSRNFSRNVSANNTGSNATGSSGSGRNSADFPEALPTDKKSDNDNIGGEHRKTQTGETIQRGDHLAKDGPSFTAVRSRTGEHRNSSTRDTISGASSALGLDADAKRSAARSTSSAARSTSSGGVTTQWETPFNRPAYESPDSMQYSRLASQYLQQGRIEDAERLYNLGLEVAERTLPGGDPSLIRAIEDLAGFYLANDKHQAAEHLVSRLLEARVQTLAPDDSLLIRTVDQLAEIYENTARVAQSQSLYKFLLAKQEETLGRNSETVAFTLSRLSDCYARQENFGACEALLTRILEIQETIYGRSSIEISNTLQELSRVYHQQKRYDKAAEMLERLLHILETIHGFNGLAVASCLLKLADLLTEVCMIHEAEPLYRRAQQIYQTSYGRDTAASSIIGQKLSRINLAVDVTPSVDVTPAVDFVRSEQETCSSWPAFKVENTESENIQEDKQSISAQDTKISSTSGRLRQWGEGLSNTTTSLPVLAKPQQNGESKTPRDTRITRRDLKLMESPAKSQDTAGDLLAICSSNLLPEPFPNARKNKETRTQELFASGNPWVNSGMISESNSEND